MTWQLAGLLTAIGVIYVILLAVLCDDYGSKRSHRWGTALWGVTAVIIFNLIYYLGWLNN